MGKYLDSIGLNHLISKIKSMFTANVHITDENIDLSTTPSSGIYHRVIQIDDVNGDCIGWVQAHQDENGAHGISIGTHDLNDPDGTTHQIMLSMNGSTPGCWVSQAASVRSGIGAAASNHAHGSISHAGAITSNTEAASGDKLVIADDSDSSKLKRSSIAFGTDTTMFLRNDGTWAAPSGGGDVAYTTQDVNIPVSAWSGGTATVSTSSVTVLNDVLVAPAPASASVWAAAGIVCTAQGAGTLTFACSTAPTETVTANVMCFEGGTYIVPSTYNVTIMTTNPTHTGEAMSPPCKLYESENGELDGSNWALGNQIGSMGHTDTKTVEVDRELFGIVAVFNNDYYSYVSDSGITCTGGVSNGGARSTRVLLKVDGDGTATIDGVDYDA